MKFSAYAITVENVPIYIGEGRTAYTDATSGRTHAGRLERHRMSVNSLVKGFKPADGQNAALYRYLVTKLTAGMEIGYVHLFKTDSKADAFAYQEAEIARIIAEHGRDALPFNAQINGKHTNIGVNDNGDKIEGMIRGKYQSRLAAMTEEERKKHQYALAKESRDRVKLGVYVKDNKLAKLTRERYRERVNFRTNALYHRRKAVKADDLDQVAKIEKEMEDYDRALGLEPEPIRKAHSKGRAWAHMTREEEAEFLAPFVARNAPATEIRKALEDRFGKYSLKCVYDLYKRHGVKSPRSAKAPQQVKTVEPPQDDQFTESEKAWIKRKKRSLIEKIEEASKTGDFDRVIALTKMLADPAGQLKLAKEQGRFLPAEHFQKITTHDQTTAYV